MIGSHTQLADIRGLTQAVGELQIVQGGATGRTGFASYFAIRPSESVEIRAGAFAALDSVCADRTGWAEPRI